MATFISYNIVEINIVITKTACRICVCHGHFYPIPYNRHKSMKYNVNIMHLIVTGPISCLPLHNTFIFVNINLNL